MLRGGKIVSKIRLPKLATPKRKTKTSSTSHFGHFNLVRDFCRHRCNQLRRMVPPYLGLSPKEKWNRRMGEDGEAKAYTVGRLPCDKPVSNCSIVVFPLVCGLSVLEICGGAVGRSPSAL